MATWSRSGQSVNVGEYGNDGSQVFPSYHVAVSATCGALLPQDSAQDYEISASDTAAGIVDDVGGRGAGGLVEQGTEGRAHQHDDKR